MFVAGSQQLRISGHTSSDPYVSLKFCLHDVASPAFISLRPVSKLALLLRAKYCSAITVTRARITATALKPHHSPRPLSNRCRAGGLKRERLAVRRCIKEGCSGITSAIELTSALLLKKCWAARKASNFEKVERLMFPLRRTIVMDRSLKGTAYACSST